MNNIFICIENEGEVDVNAFRLLGASTKEGDSTKIGFFGSGTKYALASALRMGIPVKIFSGAKEIKIGTRKTKMRNESFDVITINGSPTGMTTRMGKDWQSWFIFREFYCNAIDEGGEKLTTTDSPVGEKGKTRIYLGMEGEMTEVLNNFDSYFSKKREALGRLSGINIYPRLGNKMTVYRKGIRVFHEHESIYDYDFDSIPMNESRVSSDFDCEWRIVGLWKTKATETMISGLVNSRDSYEFNMSWDWNDSSMSKAWLTYLANKTIIPKEHSGYFADDASEYHITLPYELCKCLHAAFGEKLRIRGFQDRKNGVSIMEMGEREIALIEEATSFLEKAGVNDIRSYPVKMAILESGTAGEVIDGEILVASDTFTKGKRNLVETLLEEYIHAKTKESDRTRGMQNRLIELTITAMETATKTYL